MHATCILSAFSLWPLGFIHCSTAAAERSGRRNCFALTHHMIITVSQHSNIAQPLPSQMRFWQGVYYNPCPLSALCSLLSLCSLSALLAPVRGLFLLPYNLATNEDSDLILSGYDH